MSRRFTPVFVMLFMVATSAAAQVENNPPALSPTTQLFLEDIGKANGSLPPSYVYRRNATGNVCVAAMIKVNTAVNEHAFEAIGATVGTRAGNIWTVSIPVQAVQMFTGLRGIDYIDLDMPLVPHMDSARKVSRVDSVHHGNTPLPMPYSGRNVVVGIIDAGFDYYHPTTMDTSGSNTRIKKIWEQKVSGTAPSGFSYGNEITSAAAMQTAGTDLKQFSHGAHVAGIAAGSGYGTANAQYRGIAFESDMVFVGITPDSTQWMNTGMSDIVDGMDYIFKYAASIGRPALANLSWGCTVGPHDGNSLFSQACDNLTGKGKIFVCSGGNNGTNNVHLAKAFTASDTIVRTQLTLANGMRNTWVDVWGDTSKLFCMNISLYNGTTQTAATGFVCLDNSTRNFALVGSDGDTCFIDVVTETTSFNGKPRAFIRVHRKTADRIMVSAKGTGGAIDMWTGYVEKVTGYYGGFTSGLPGTLSGDNDFTVGDMATTRSAISVASFASNIQFTNLSGNPISYGSYVPLNGLIAPYSSRGPSADMRTKPDIAAPGLMIGSGVSVYDDDYKPAGGSADHLVASYLSPADGKTYYYAMLTGTSMSSPVVAGIVALMLQANPNLTPATVMQILKNTAIHDNYTGAATPNGDNVWGHGKVNAFAAVVDAIRFGNTAELHKAATQVALYPNPNNGAFLVEYTANQAGEDVEVSIADISGRVLSAQHIKAGTGKTIIPFNMQGYTAGIYMVRITSATQGSSVVKMVVQ